MRNSSSPIDKNSPYGLSNLGNDQNKSKEEIKAMEGSKIIKNIYLN